LLPALRALETSSSASNWVRTDLGGFISFSSTIDGK